MQFQKSIPRRRGMGREGHGDPANEGLGWRETGLRVVQTSVRARQFEDQKWLGTGIVLKLQRQPSPIQRASSHRMPSHSGSALFGGCEVVVEGVGGCRKLLMVV